MSPLCLALVGALLTGEFQTVINIDDSCVYWPHLFLSLPVKYPPLRPHDARRWVLFTVLIWVLQQTHPSILAMFNSRLLPTFRTANQVQIAIR